MRKIYFLVIICLFAISNNTFGQTSTSKEASAVFYWLPLNNSVIRTFKIRANEKTGGKEMELYDLLVIYVVDDSTFMDKHAYLEVNDKNVKMFQATGGTTGVFIQGREMVWNGFNWVEPGTFTPLKRINNFTQHFFWFIIGEHSLIFLKLNKKFGKNQNLQISLRYPK